MNVFTRLTIARDQEYFFDNLLMLLASGIDVASAFSALEKSARTRTMKRIIAAMRAQIEEGKPLSRVIQQQQLLPTQMVNLVRIGEKSGKLIENLTVVVTQIQKDKTLKSKITSAMLYPLFVFGLTIIVGIGIAWFLLPNLANVFSQLRIQLPLVTVILIGFGRFLGRYGLFVVPGFVIGMIAVIILFSSYRPAKEFGQSVLFLIPGMHDVLQDVELTRFGFILGSLLGAGLPFPDALSLLADSTTIYRYKRMYTVLRQQVDDGHSFAKSINGYPNSATLIPIPFQQLLTSAEASGKLADTLSHIGTLSEAKTDTATKNLSVLLEPVLLVIVWLCVLWVAISVILPLYSLIGGINNATP